MMNGEYSIGDERRILLFIARKAGIDFKDYEDLQRIVREDAKKAREAQGVKMRAEMEATRSTQNNRLEDIGIAEFGHKILVDLDSKRLSRIEDARCSCGEEINLRGLLRNAASELDRFSSRPVNPVNEVIKCQKCGKSNALMVQVVR